MFLFSHFFEFSGKTFTLLSDDGVTSRVVQHCFEKIDNDEIHTYKVSMKLSGFSLSPTHPGHLLFVKASRTWEDVENVHS